MNILKKQGVAWVITIVMIFAAIGIGQAKSITSSTPPISEPSSTAPIQVPSDWDGLYIYDNANVLSVDEETKLSQLNEELYAKFGTVVACVTTNYNKSDLYSFALDYADSIGLDAYDFIVVLDISGDNYWLVQGAGLVSDFTDDDCGDYAWDYMEDHFARGDYGEALISLVAALSDWCQNSWS